jgi:hypothetical protein
MCQGMDINKNDPDIIDESIKNFISYLYNNLVELRDSDNFLWNKSEFLIYANYRGVEAVSYYLLIEKHLNLKLEFDEASFLRLMQKVLQSSEIKYLFMKYFADEAIQKISTSLVVKKEGSK